MFGHHASHLGYDKVVPTKDRNQFRHHEGLAVQTDIPMNIAESTAKVRPIYLMIAQLTCCRSSSPSTGMLGLSRHDTYF